MKLFGWSVSADASLNLQRFELHYDSYYHSFSSSSYSSSYPAAAAATASTFASSPQAPILPGFEVLPPRLHIKASRPACEANEARVSSILQNCAPSLESLEVYNNVLRNLPWKDQRYAEHGLLPSLQHLTISAKLSNVNFLRCAPNLRRLNIETACRDNGGVSSIAKLSKLRSLTLWSSHLRDISPLEALTGTLRELNVCSKRLIEGLPTLKKLVNLRVLRL